MLERKSKEIQHTKRVDCGRLYRLEAGFFGMGWQNSMKISYQKIAVAGRHLTWTLAAAPLENGWLCLASRGACTQLVDAPHADELPVEAPMAEEPLVRE